MALTIEPDLENVELNNNAKYLGQRSFPSKEIVLTNRHSRPTGLLGH